MDQFLYDRDLRHERVIQKNGTAHNIGATVFENNYKKKKFLFENFFYAKST